MRPGERETLIAEARLAPSVHNVQPACWRLEGEAGLTLFEDLNCRLRIGDPQGRDAAISLGAAQEGLRLAAGRRKFALVEAPVSTGSDRLRAVAGFRLVRSGAPADPLAEHVEARKSWRADFLPTSPGDEQAALALAGEDAAILADRAALIHSARLLDKASFSFIRQSGFRSELRAWMRLSRRHERWGLDGLNADAMAMSRIEAKGAGLLLGPAFPLFNFLRLARPLLAEGRKLEEAAALVLFHRDPDEPPFESGRHFYRLWLRLEAAGFGASVLAALADDQDCALQIIELAGIPMGRRLVSAFRIGRRPSAAIPDRARRPLHEVLV